MKKNKLITLLAFVFTFLSVLFKIMHWPGANILFLFSQIGLLGSVILAFNENSNQNLSFKTNITITILLTALIVVGSLYYFHWIILFVFQATSLLVGGMLFLFISNSEDNKGITMSYWLTVLIYVISVTTILSSKINFLVENNNHLENIIIQ
jgi:heme/copper-type cytochrome/quinol oxidase subunit 4